MAKQVTAPAADSAANRPVQTLRHRSLKATIWRNETENGPMYNVMITRSYRDKESKEWRDTHSFSYDDLMNVAKLMYDAHSTISLLRAMETGDSRQGRTNPARNAGDRKS